MEIFEIAKQLGVAIAESDTVKNMIMAEDKMMADKKSEELIKDFSDVQRQLVDAVNSGLPEGEVASIQEMLKKQYDIMMEYEVTANYFNSKQEFDGTMKQINAIIAFEIKGETEDEGCGESDCASCSGCH